MDFGGKKERKIGFFPGFYPIFPVFDPKREGKNGFWISTLGKSAQKQGKFSLKSLLLGGNPGKFSGNRALLYKNHVLQSSKVKEFVKIGFDKLTNFRFVQN